MSFARIITRLLTALCLASLFGCAHRVTETTNRDGSVTKTTETKWVSTPYATAIVAPPVFYYTGYPVYYDRMIGHYYHYNSRRVHVAPYIVARCIRRGNVVPRC